MKKFFRPKVIMILVVPLVIVGVGFRMLWKTQQATAGNFITATISQGDIRYKVSATGVVQAVTTVQVGSQISGRIQNLYADYNSVISKGQLLAQIDPATFSAAVDRSKALLATAEASIKTAEASLANRRAELLNAKANSEATRVAETDAKRALARSQELFQAGLIPARDLESVQATADQATARHEQARAQVTQSEAQIRSASAQLEQAKAQVQEAKANLEMSDINLKYTTILSPIDGVVIERNVDAGQTVAASLQTPTLFLIAQDLTRMQVLAAIDEADIGSISENARVEFTVDAFPGERFAGKIQEIRLNAKTVQNVVTYSVVISVENPHLKLRPGMTASISIIIAELSDALKVPNAALRFRPTNSPEDIDRAAVPGSAKKDSAATGPRGETSTPTAANPSASAAGASASMGGGEGLSAEKKARLRKRWEQMTPEDREKFMARTQGRRGRGSGDILGEVASSKPQADLNVKMNPGDKVHFRSASIGREVTQVIWVLDDKKQAQPHHVKLGITDGMDTALLEGDLKVNDQVIIGETVDPDKKSNGGVSSPFGRTMMPGGGRPPARQGR
ncbi:MAG: efflux RND transporter periplasmic adaptor subunit [Acidobacteria bacterium]|nr:efflux RND transporter periplasmic adaptor subunit [Acidobacteriota bacterium]MBI3656130.1 efflux RND transporter periplasmic adaptor subunit [Acidobacteriota bacterium]